MPTINERPAIDVGRSLAIVHQLSQSHIDELKKISQTKVCQFYWNILLN